MNGNRPRIPVFLESTYRMLLQAFPEGVDEENYWALLCLLYDHMADENLAFIMSVFTDKPLGVIANDIYKAPGLNVDQAVIQKVKYKLDACGFEGWKTEE